MAAVTFPHYSSMCVRVWRALCLMIKLSIILMLVFIASSVYHHDITHLSHTLPRVNLSDLADTRLLCVPAVCEEDGGASLDVLVLVHSALENRHAREAIRASWGSDKTSVGIVSAVVFILGFSQNTTDQAMVNTESREHEDIVQAEFMDSYRNLSYKNLLGLHWVTLYCPSARLVVKTDDDYFLDLYGIHHLSQEILADKRFLTGGLLACPMIVNSAVYRDPSDSYTGRWAITEAELSPARLSKWQRRGSKRDYYPPYCTGTLYHCTL